MILRSYGRLYKIVCFLSIDIYKDLALTLGLYREPRSLQSYLSEASLRPRRSPPPYPSQDIPPLLALRLRAHIRPSARRTDPRHTLGTWDTRSANAGHRAAHPPSSSLPQPKDTDPSEAGAAREYSAHGGSGRGAAQELRVP